MSDVAPQGVGTTAPAGEAPAETNVDWEARYRAEVQERVAERERYKPVASAFQNLHPDDARAIQDFVKAYANGDTETATRWMIDNAKTLAGDKFNEFVSPQQEAAITQQAQIDGASQGLSPQQVEQMVNQRIEQFQMQQAQAYHEQQIEQTLMAHGYQPDSAIATAAIVAATKRPDLDLGAAIREVEDELLQRASAIAQRRAEAAQSMGAPAPNGVSGVSMAGREMSPRERALARLEAQGL